jgi:hypothetical protein
LNYIINLLINQTSINFLLSESWMIETAILREDLRQ